MAEVADGRVGLLAGGSVPCHQFREHGHDAQAYLQIAQLCIKSGADTTLVSSWIEEGWRRGCREAASFAG